MEGMREFRTPENTPELDPTRVEDAQTELCYELLDRLEDDFDTVDIVNCLFERLGTDAAMCLWLRTPNSGLDNRTPLAAIEAGEFDEVLKAARSAEIPETVA